MTNAIDRRLDMVTTIVVIVGEGNVKKEFTILQSIVTRSSRFMQTTRSGEGRESREKRVYLPETHVSDFEVYLEWLYTGHVTMLHTWIVQSFQLIPLWLLGESLGDDQFCNAIIDIIVHPPPGEARIDLLYFWLDINQAWSKTRPGFMLRKILVELIVCDIGRDS
jgi:hypothetical protein